MNNNTKELCKLRHWAKGDLGVLISYANNEKIARNLADAFPSPFTKKDGLAFIKRALKDEPTKIFAVTYEDIVVGAMGIFPEADIYRKNAAIAYWIAEPFWGKGIATEAIRKIIEYGFNTFDLNRIFAKPFATNIASQKALEKAGLKFEARFQNTVYKNGAFLDEVVYGIQKNEFKLNR